MLAPATKADVLRDIRVALIIHAMFVSVVLVYAIFPPDSSIFFLSSLVFVPQWATFCIASGIDSIQPLALLIVRGFVGFCLSFVFSLLYAAAWRSVLYLGSVLVSSRKARATPSA
ncbi:MAG TPA: hypothetical protein VGW39_16070 [Chthoniobacterales bacterium]|nr:hypothetical protein [Chthoniobacterales bacterium]